MPARGCAALAVALLSLWLASGGGAAWAHAGTDPAARHGREAPVTGLVTGLSRGTLQVQTPGGSLNLAITATTHVVRLVTGSGADLTPNTWVDLRLRPGTATVEAVRIDLTAKTQPTAKSPPTDHVLARTRSRVGGAERPGAGAGRTSRRPRVEMAGKIVALHGGTLTIRDRHGQIATFTLADSVDVTKVMTGRLSDLAIGEMVQVFVFIGQNTTTCLTITILSA